MTLLRLLTLAGAFALGIASASHWSVPSSVPLWLLILAAALAVVRYARGTSRCQTHILLLALALVGGALGIVRMEQAKQSLAAQTPPAPLGTEVSITGTISSEPDYRDHVVQLTVETASSTLQISTDRYAPFAVGDTIQATGTITRPEAFTTDYGRTFDYPGYLAVRGITYTMSFAEVATIAPAAAHSPLGWLLAAKEHFAAAVDDAIPEPAAGLGLGLLLGVQAGLGESLESDFRQTGIIHIVVLSGYNVMLVVAFIYFCLGWVRSAWVRVGVGVVAIATFALLVGASATVVRASVMASLLLLAFALGRRYDVLRGLLVAGLLMLLINPHLLLYDIGFQLSFMATLGLILLVPQFESTTATQPGGIRWREFLLATIATQLAVLPLLIYHIGEVSLVAVAVNLLVLPVVPAAMLLTFLTGLASLVPALDLLATGLGYLAWWSLMYIIWVAQTFAALPLASVIVPPLSWLVLPLGYGVLGGLYATWRWWRTRGRWVGPSTPADPLVEWTIEPETIAIKRPAGSQEPAGQKGDRSSEEPIFFRE